VPGRDELIDGAFAMGLVAVGALGWMSVFTAPGALFVPVWAALIGVVAAWLTAARRFDPLVSLAVLLVAFIVGSGPAVPTEAIAGILPGPGSPAALIDSLVHSWTRLITTAAPVGFDAGLGVVPYVCGFLAGALAVLLARRTAATMWPVTPALAALAAGLAFGDVEPVNVVAQGLGFATIALGWGAVRANRPLRSVDGEVYWPRIAGGMVMLAVVGAVAVLVAPHLPGVDPAQRTVLRDAVPPFDPANYPSPLAGLRNLRKDHRDTVYFEVENLRKGDRIRLATMDTYDGVVWTVGGDGETSGTFERVGAQVRYHDRSLVGPVGSWPTRTLDLSVIDYRGVWIPTFGVTEAIGLSGPGSTDVREALRVNRATGTAGSAVVPSEGLEIAASGSLSPPLTGAQKASARPCASGAIIQPTALASLESFQKLAPNFMGGEELAPFARAQAIEKRLVESGYFSDAMKDDPQQAQVRAGHSAARLTDFLRVKNPIGNAEQYAAAMAVMANLSGLPARVVLGFTPEGSGSVAVRGGDADAWVEVCFAELGWVSFNPTPTRPPKDEPEPVVEKSVLPQPLSQQQQPSVPETIPENEKQHRKPNPPRNKIEQPKQGALPAWVGMVLAGVGIPLGLLAAFVLAVLALKARRRRRRRGRGGPVQQVQGAWAEAVDRLRDLGHEPPPRATRREIALHAASDGYWVDGPRFASEVDAYMFGPSDPDETVVDDAWSALNHHVRAIYAPLSRRRRMRAAVSTASLRPPRTRPRRGRGSVPGSDGEVGGSPKGTFRSPSSVADIIDQTLHTDLQGASQPLAKFGLQEKRAYPAGQSALSLAGQMPMVEGDVGGQSPSASVQGQGAPGQVASKPSHPVVISGQTPLPTNQVRGVPGQTGNVLGPMDLSLSAPSSPPQIRSTPVESQKIRSSVRLRAPEIQTPRPEVPVPQASALQAPDSQVSDHRVPPAEAPVPTDSPPEWKPVVMPPFTEDDQTRPQGAHEAPRDGDTR